MPEEKIREYKVIGGPFAGTYGEVVIGQHLHLNFKRAIKRLHAHVRSDVIRDEVLKQQAINSPYVVHIYDFFDLAEDRYAILMEFCPIGLTEYLRERFSQTSGHLPYDEARELLYGILRGLNDAHNAGIIHGDIKPANVRFGEDTFPKLSDFGAARRQREAGFVIKGSTNWMAPEVLAGGETTKESDYFSFGVLAYLVLSGRHPYFAGDPSCLTSEEYNIANAAFVPERLSSLRTDIPIAVADLVMELLSRGGVRERAEQALKAALAEPPSLEPGTPSAVMTADQPTPEEIARLGDAYNDARQKFFMFFRPRDAVEALDRVLDGFGTTRFKGKRVAKLADCWSLRAYINNSAGLFEAAISSATHGLEVDEDHVSSLHARGYAFIQIAKYTDAIKDLERALERTEDSKKRIQIRGLIETAKSRALS
jgi:serine/threonine protein kinase